MSKMSILSSEFCGKKKFRALNNRERIRENVKLTFDIPTNELVGLRAFAFSFYSWYICGIKI